MIALEEIFPDIARTLGGFPEPGRLAGRRVLVYAFNTMPPLVPYFALYALVLAHRGATVDLAWRPYLETHQYLPREALDAHNARAEALLDAIGHPRLTAVNLAGLPLSPPPPGARDIVETQAAMDVSHFRRSVETDIAGEDRAVYRRYLRLHQECLGALETLLRENRYDSVLMPTGDGVQFGAAYRFFRAKGLAVCTVEAFRCGRDRAAIVSWGAPAVSFNRDFIDGPWAAFDEDLDEATVEDCLGRLARRFQNQASHTSIQIAASGQVAALRRSLALDPRLPVLLVTPSHNYEKHFRLRHPVFDNGLRWFEETLVHLAGRDDCQVLVRLPPLPGSDGESDPHELAVSRDSGSATFARLFPQCPAHFRLFGPFDKVSTYDLMGIADGCLTYNSTTGLEMALLGKAALVPTSIHYTGKGFTPDPDSREDYFRQLDRLIRDPAARVLSPAQVRLARRYAVFLYFHFPRRLPWSLRHRRFLYDQWPMERLLSLEGALSPFTDSIDFLADAEADADSRAKCDEVRGLLAAVRAAAGAGDPAKARRLLGRLWEVDLARLGRERPQVLALLLGEWDGLVSLALSGGHDWRVYDFMGQLRALAESATAGPEMSHLGLFLSEAAARFEAGDRPDATARLVESDFLGFMDIYAFRGRWYGLDRSLRPATPDAYEPQALGELEKQGLCFIAADRETVSRNILRYFKELPVLIQEGYRGYNIVLCNGMLYALAQELGRVDPLRLLREPQPLVNAGLLIPGQDLEAVRREVDRTLGRRAARMRRLTGEDA